MFKRINRKTQENHRTNSSFKDLSNMMLQSALSHFVYSRLLLNESKINKRILQEASNCIGKRQESTIEFNFDKLRLLKSSSLCGIPFLATNTVKSITIRPHENIQDNKEEKSSKESRTRLILKAPGNYRHYSSFENLSYTMLQNVISHFGYSRLLVNEPKINKRMLQEVSNFIGKPQDNTIEFNFDNLKLQKSSSLYAILQDQTPDNKQTI